MPSELHHSGSAGVSPCPGVAAACIRAGLALRFFRGTAVGRTRATMKMTIAKILMVIIMVHDHDAPPMRKTQYQEGQTGPGG